MFSLNINLQFYPQTPYLMLCGHTRNYHYDRHTLNTEEAHASFQIASVSFVITNLLAGV